jgi:hypothetical protein
VVEEPQDLGSEDLTSALSAANARVTCLSLLDQEHRSCAVLADFAPVSTSFAETLSSNCWANGSGIHAYHHQFYVWEVAMLRNATNMRRYHK